MGCIALMTGTEKRCRSAVMGMLAIYSFVVPAPGSEGRKNQPERQEEERSHEESPGDPPWDGWDTR